MTSSLPCWCKYQFQVSPLIHRWRVRKRGEEACASGFGTLSAAMSDKRVSTGINGMIAGESSDVVWFRDGGGTTGRGGRDENVELNMRDMLGRPDWDHLEMPEGGTVSTEGEGCRSPGGRPKRRFCLWKWRGCRGDGSMEAGNWLWPSPSREQLRGKAKKGGAFFHSAYTWNRWNSVTLHEINSSNFPRPLPSND